MKLSLLQRMGGQLLLILFVFNTAEAQVGPPTGSCLKSSKGARTNLGLYGGSSLDLSFSQTGRLFGAIETPASLFISDDTAKTWYQAFPDDSLEYDCGRGWGGRATKVLTNTKGWVAVQTSQNLGTLTASVVNFSNGDTGKWQTAVDPRMIEKLFLGGGNTSIKSIALSDYYMFVGAQSRILRLNETGLDMANVIDFKTVATIPDEGIPMSIAAANQASGYPIYMVVDTLNNPSTTTGVLFRYDGVSATLISKPTGTDGFSEVFISNGNITGDTIFCTAAQGMNKMSYVSFDAGATWDTVWNNVNMWAISDVDYHPSHKGVKGDGTVISVAGSGFSFDYGVTWEQVQLQNNGLAVHPTNPDLMVGTKGRGVAVSTSGYMGPFNVADNYGLEAVKINQIARSKGKGVFYIATRAGLAYTTEYKNTSIANYAKWNAPYGEFPIAAVGDDAGVTAVAIDPNDSTHVVAGYSNGFSVTTTGPSGFTNVNPSSWNSGQMDPIVQDIKFITSQLVLAVTGGENQGHSGSGNIYRSTDGGYSWSKITPVGFAQGTSISVYKDATDTIVYVGAGMEQSNNAVDYGALWKSTDAGLTWSKVAVGPTSLNGMKTELPILDVAVKSSSADTVYIAAGSNLDYAFAYSIDGGVTFKNVDINGEGAFSSVMLNQNNEDTVYVAIRRELYVYDVLNDSATLVFRGLPGELIPDLTWGSVIAGTSTGAYKLNLDFSSEEVESSPELASSNLGLYPNPSNGKVSLQLDGVAGNVNLTITNLLGNSVYEKNATVSANQIIDLDLSALAEGTYFITLSSNSKQFSGKVIIVK